MINIIREGSQVKLTFNTGVAVAKNTLTFFWNCVDELWAELLVNKMQKQMKTCLEAIRKTAYDEGWKDAKKKCQKETYFSGWL